MQQVTYEHNVQCRERNQDPRSSRGESQSLGAPDFVLDKFDMDKTFGVMWATALVPLNQLEERTLQMSAPYFVRPSSLVCGAESGTMTVHGTFSVRALSAKP